MKQEWMAALAGRAISIDCASLYGWAKAVKAGAAEPTSEPEMPASSGQPLQYRAVGQAVMIFVLRGSLMLILFVGRSASAYPRVPDLDTAAGRLTKWRP